MKAMTFKRRLLFRYRTIREPAYHYQLFPDMPEFLLKSNVTSNMLHFFWCGMPRDFSRLYDRAAELHNPEAIFSRYANH
jgi:hypothetical protein